MYQLDKCIFVTNNDRAAAEFSDRAEQIVLLEDYREVLVTVRDLIYAGHKLLSHPQASSLKPNQTPYRTVLVYGEVGKVDFNDVSLIEKAIETFDKWQEIRHTPVYNEKIAYDYKTIDLSMIENIIPKL